MKPAIIGIIIILIIAIAGIALFQSAKKSPQTAQPTPTSASMKMQATAAPSGTASAQPSSSSSPSAMQTGTEKDFTVSGQNYSFTPNQLTVNKGDKVKITFKNSGGIHDFVIDAFNVRTQPIETGGESTVTFTADKTGSFEFYCSVDGHRAMGMKGTLTVQ